MCSACSLCHTAWVRVSVGREIQSGEGDTEWHYRWETHGPGLASLTLPRLTDCVWWRARQVCWSEQSLNQRNGFVLVQLLSVTCVQSYYQTMARCADTSYNTDVLNTGSRIENNQKRLKKESDRIQLDKTFEHFTYRCINGWHGYVKLFEA